MKLKYLLGVGFVVGALAGSRAGATNTIVLNQDSYSFVNGGEFSASTSPGSFLGAYAPETIVNGGFETFCVEVSVYF